MSERIHNNVKGRATFAEGVQSGGRSIFGSLALTGANATDEREQLQSYNQSLRSASADLRKQGREALTRAREAVARSQAQRDRQAAAPEREAAQNNEAKLRFSVRHSRANAKAMTRTGDQEPATGFHAR